MRRPSIESPQLSLLSQSPATTERVATRRQEQLVLDYLEIEREDAVSAGSISYMPVAMIQATLPYREPKGDLPVWTKSNGDVSMVIQPGYGVVNHTVLDAKGNTKIEKRPVCFGYPYGTLPRLLLSWVATQAFIQKNPNVVLGKNLSGFMENIGLLSKSGGEFGTITRLKDQCRRLFGARISLTRQNLSDRDMSHVSSDMRIASSTAIWDPDEGKPIDNFGSSIVLGEQFYREIIAHPLPIDFRVIKSLTRSALAIDIYCWLTWRMSFTTKPVSVPWSYLMAQFGSQTESEKKFRETFRKALGDVLIVYPQARVNATTAALILSPSPTSIPLRTSRLT